MNLDQIAHAFAWLATADTSVVYAVAVDNSAGGWLGTVLANWKAHADVAASFSIATLAVILALASLSQTRSIRKRLEAVKNEFFAALRPRFILRDVHPKSFEAGGPIEVTFSVCNVGSSTAHIVESVLSLDVEHWNSPRRVPKTAGKNIIGPVILDAGETQTFTYPAPERTWNRNLMKDSDVIALIFSGRIAYMDASGVVRETSFCRAFDSSRERFYALRDPDLEYAD